MTRAATEQERRPGVKTWAVLGAALTLNAAANVLVKAAMRGRELSLAEPVALLSRVLSNGLFWGGVACFAAALLLYSVALSRMDLSVAYPVMTGVGFAIVVTASGLLFREPITGLKLAGYALVFLGVFLLAR